MRLCDAGLRLALMGGAFLCLAASAGAETSFIPPVIEVEYGVHCDYTPGGQDVPAPDTNAGMVRRGGPAEPFDVLTDVVPARIGVAFGIRTLLDPSVGIQTVTMVTRHPSFGPGYRDTESWTSTMTGGAASSRNFVFEFDYELATGPWTMEIFLDGQRILTQTFLVVSPESTEICPGPQPMS